MTLRAYDAERDRGACLALFDGNVGGAFRADERAAFVAYLDHLPGPYLVMEEDDRLVACGGWAPEDAPGLAALCWTMVEQARHGEGLGMKLHRRLMQDAAEQGRPRLRLETIPETVPFFERLGFRVVEEDPDGYGPGLPRVEMRR